jgi:hypothetical protein
MLSEASLAEASNVEPEVAETETPKPLFAVEQPAVESTDAPNYSSDPDALEVDEEPSRAVFAYRAPEPAVDMQDSSWQEEAPLSVVRRPQPSPHLVPLNSDASSGPVDDVDSVINDALKQLDDTLELIRSLKQRSA